MRKLRNLGMLAVAAVVLPLGACSSRSDRGSAGGDVQRPADQALSPSAAPVAGPTSSTSASADTAAVATHHHHSKLAGALVGAAVGHVAGGHAMAGAAAGALVQHERNKHQP